MGITNPLHIAFIAAVALIVLGPKRLPEVARALGNGMREFREALTNAVNVDDQPTAPAMAPLPAPDPIIVTATAPPPGSLETGHGNGVATPADPGGPAPAPSPPAPDQLED